MTTQHPPYKQKLLNRSDKKSALLALTVASITWGLGVPVIKWTLEITPVYLYAFLKYLIGALLIYIILRPPLTLKKKDIPLLFGSAFVGISLHGVLLFNALTITSAINASLIAASTPIMTLIAAVLVLHEKISFRLVVGGIIGILGVSIVIFDPILSSGKTFDSSLFGNILLFLSVATFIVYELITKRTLFRKYQVPTVTVYSFLIGSISFLPFAFGPIKNTLPNIIFHPQFVIGVAFGSFFASALAFSMWQWGLSKIDVSRVGFFLYLDPVAASVMSFFLLGETIDAIFFTGSILVFAGLYIAEGKLHFPHVHFLHAHMGKKTSEITISKPDTADVRLNS